MGKCNQSGDQTNQIVIAHKNTRIKRGAREKWNQTKKERKKEATQTHIHKTESETDQFFVCLFEYSVLIFI